MYYQKKSATMQKESSWPHKVAAAFCLISYHLLFKTALQSKQEVHPEWNSVM